MSTDTTSRRRVAFQTFGCRLNQSESEGLSASIVEQGYDVVPFRETADLYVINTCSVTLGAESDARRAIRRARERGGVGARVVVTGCYAQRDPAAIAAIPGVDVVLGNDRKSELPELVGVDGLAKQVAVGDIGSVTTFAEFAIPSRSERTRAYLRVQDGCEDPCTFCVVPLTRGKFRSMAPERAVQRLRELVRDGYREIVMTGANLSSYGTESNTPFAELLARLLAVDGDYRIRLSSFEPSDLTPELVDLLATSDRLCRHVHLPVQSLDDGVLARMRRSYTAAEACEAAHALAERVPGISIGTDLMVGFPGEDEGAFLSTLKRVTDLPLSYFHVFPYSPRPGTEAAFARDDVHPDEKKRRSRALRDVGAAKAVGFAGRHVGTETRVLTERTDSTGQHWRGYTDNYLRVTTRATSAGANEFIPVTLDAHNLDVLRQPRG